MTHLLSWFFSYLQFSYPSLCSESAIVRLQVDYFNNQKDVESNRARFGSDNATSGKIKSKYSDIGLDFIRVYIGGKMCQGKCQSTSFSGQIVIS